MPEVSFSSAATGQIEPQAVDQAVEIINRVNQLMDNGLDFTVKVLTQSNLEAVRKDVIL
jgi:predicted RNA-binding protein associated with RNAse of E/G family